MKKNEMSMLKEYVKNLSDEDIRFLVAKFTQNCCGDYADIFDKLSCNGEIDRWLKSSVSADHLFEMIDKVAENVFRESKRRFTLSSTEEVCV